MGGKEKISKDLCKFLQPIVDKAKGYWEPFCGGLSVISKIQHRRRVASDNFHIIHVYKHWQQGWRPIFPITEQDYQNAKLLPDGDPQKHFAGIACGFCGVYFAGYAGMHTGMAGYNSLERKMATCGDVRFIQADYREVKIPEGWVIYCDPPYAGGEKYRDIGKRIKFDNSEFWKWAEKASEKNILLVSEYKAPEGWESVWCRRKQMEIGGKSRDIKLNELLFALK